MSSDIQIRKALHEDLPVLKALLAAQSISLPESYFDDVVAKFKSGGMDIIVALKDEAIIGYGFLNWAPKYALYKRLDIPEIQNVNVLHDHRCGGVGREIIEFAEGLVRDDGRDQVGVSVGLHKDYGAAQRLYTKMGYIPDGTGITYDRETVQIGEIRPVDDDLCLMMVKDLA